MKSEQVYVGSLPEHYRQKWEKEGISTRALEAEQQARTSLRARLASTSKDAVRRQCGPQAQRLDQEMRQDRNKYDPHFGVLVRIDAMRREEDLAERERQEAKSQEQDRPHTREPQRAPHRGPQQKQGMELSR